MRLKKKLEVDIFDIRGISFMGHFPYTMGNKLILVVDDYVSKWIKEILSPTNDALVVTKILKKNVIFPRFDVHRLVISDGGSHFISK